MTRNRKHLNACQFCRAVFNSNRSDAKFCSAKCRQNHYKATKFGKGKTWHSVRPEYVAMAHDVKSVSEKAFDAIQQCLWHHGAIAAEYAIASAFEASKACIEALEGIHAKTLQS